MGESKDLIDLRFEFRLGEVGAESVDDLQLVFGEELEDAVELRHPPLIAPSLAGGEGRSQLLGHSRGGFFVERLLRTHGRTRNG